MEETIKVYKIVRTDPLTGRLYSKFAAGAWQLEYKLGEWVYPSVQNAYLFAFRNGFNALDYCKEGVYLAETTELLDWIPHHIPGVQFTVKNFDEDIKKFWKTWIVPVIAGLQGNKYYMQPLPPPYGTVLCADLRLIERIA